MALKVLYIEDNKHNKALVYKLLTVAGYTVLEADNGMDGIKIAKKKNPDLILIDINMPGLDGYETTTIFRGLENFRNTPIIALTAKTTEEERERSLVAGCDGFMRKPIDVKTFVSTIEKYLEGRRETVDDTEEKGLLQDYCQYLVKSLEDKVKKLERSNLELEKKVKKRTAALEKAQARLIQLEKKKTAMELAGGAAHELNQPLTVLVSLSEIMSNSTEGCSNENREIILRIRDECGRMSDIIRKMGSLTDYKTKSYYKDINILDLD